MNFTELCNKYNLRPTCASGVGDGWVPLVERLIVELKSLGWNCQLEQCKEKFGGLRFYIDGSSPKMDEVIDAAEAESYRVCEECGQPGKPGGKGWVATLCDGCRAP